LNIVIHPVFRVITKAKVNIITMGKTGAGLESEKEIEAGSGLATKWGELDPL